MTTTQESLHSAGFDRSVRRDHAWIVRCSQCEALVINGVPTHESGCPNAKHECAGCWAMIPMQQRYCGDCQ